MSDRVKKELEEKKAKLAELRRAREERRAILAQGEKAQAEPISTSRRDVNDLVDSLLGRPASPAPIRSGVNVQLQQSGRSTPPASAPGTPGGRISRLSHEENAIERATSPNMGIVNDRESAGSPADTSVDYVEHRAELYELPKTSKPPMVTYSRGIQTTPGSSSISDSEETNENKHLDAGRETEDEMRTRILEEMEVERKALELELQELKQRAEVKTLPDLSNEQRQAIFAAPDFSAFIEESSKIVQRALSDGYDYIRDYTVGIDGAFEEADGQRVKLLCAFSDARWTAGRSVTDLDWSPKFPELIVASYNKNPTAANDPDGIVAVWNLHLLERPEFVFHAPSDVLSVTFSPFHPTLVFGGSYSGQVLLWDTRAKNLPVLKTPLSTAGHTYPIYAMKMVGTQNANNLISSSTDGLVCSWLADMLAQPQEALPLTAPSHNKTDEVAITCLDFPDSQTTTFWVGTEEGSVYQANRHDRASAKAGLNASVDDIYRGHAGPVTGIHFHPSSGSIDFSDLFLTSSVDWTVKLWRSKGSSVKPADKTTTSGISPIHSFEEADDYVFDVKWHPNHPAMFGTVDGSGKFDLWNLNQDSEIPMISTQVSPRAINKLAWDKAPLSRKAGLGSSDGKVYVYDVAEKLVSPRDSEWTELQKTVQALSSSRDQGVSVGEPLPVSGRFTR